MSVVGMLAASAPTIRSMFVGPWPARIAFIAALVVPVVILRIADRRLRAAD